MDYINVLIAGGVILAIGVTLGIGLAIANRYFEIEEDNRLEQIEFILPSYNCGACGYVSCEEMAKAILEGEVDDSHACKVISEDNAESLKDFCKKIKNNKGEKINLK